MRSINLRAKFLIGTIGLVILLGLAVIIFVQTTLTQQLLTELQKRGIFITEDIARDSVDPILTENIIDLQILVNDHMSSKKDIEYIFILDSWGKVLAHTFEEGFPIDLKEVNTVSSEQTHNIQPLVTEKGFILDIGVPILKGGAGVVHVGISEEPVRKGVAHIIRLIIGIIIVVLVLGSSAAVVFAIVMTEPIRELTEAAKIVSGGNLERRVCVRTKDEIGQLGVAFNKMITERKQAEEELRKSETLFRSVAQSAKDAIITANREGNIVTWNRGAEQIFGYEEEEIVGKPLTLLMPERYRNMHSKAIQRLHTADNDDDVYGTVELHGLRKSGEEFSIELSVAAWKTEEGPFSTGIIRDITDRKQAEEERSRLETQLRHSQKMEAIGTLAGGIAHEFNNILFVILGYTELALHATPQDSRIWDYLQNTLTASSRAKDLVQRILAFSRKSDQERRPVALNLLTQEVSFLLRASLPTTIDMRTDVKQHVGTVLANSIQMQQVLMNLCTNAEYAMRETGGVLEVRVDTIEVDTAFAAHHPDLQPGPHVRLTVRDTGHGIEPEILERIFEPFFTTKGVGEGTGMGLAMVHGIVTAHEGAITVQSTPGEGTTFEIYLPRIDETTVNEVPAEESIPHGTGRVLFVDDEDMVAEVGSALLEQLGYNVVVKTSSIEALEAFRAEPQCFDLVITDQTMPNMTGEHFAKELRRIRPDIPIILCTGFSHMINAQKAQAMEIDAFCMKPLVVRDLAVAIQQVLEKRSEFKA